MYCAVYHRLCSPTLCLFWQDGRIACCKKSDLQYIFTESVTSTHNAKRASIRAASALRASRAELRDSVMAKRWELLAIAMRPGC